jgi:hypothetical protein
MIVPTGTVSPSTGAYDADSAKLELNDCDAHDALAWKAWLNGAYEALMEAEANDAEMVRIELIELDAHEAETVCIELIELEANDAEIDCDANDAETDWMELIELDAHDADNTDPLTLNQLLSVVMSTR